MRGLRCSGTHAFTLIAILLSFFTPLDSKSHAAGLGVSIVSAQTGRLAIHFFSGKTNSGGCNETLGSLTLPVGREGFLYCNGVAFHRRAGVSSLGAARR